MILLQLQTKHISFVTTGGKKSIYYMFWVEVHVCHSIYVGSCAGRIYVIE